MNDIYEGAFWQAKVAYSSRFGNSVLWTSVGSDKIFRTPKNRVAEIIEKLCSGDDPDEVAKTLPIDEKNPRNAGRKPVSTSGKAKVRTEITIDPELKQQARDAGINISEAAELGIRAKLAELP